MTSQSPICKDCTYFKVSRNPYHSENTRYYCKNEDAWLRNAVHGGVISKECEKINPNFNCIHFSTER